MAGTSDGRLRSCRIHDLMREIILSRAKDQNIATIVAGATQGVRRSSGAFQFIYLESVSNYSQHFSLLHSFIVLGTEIQLQFHHWVDCVGVVQRF